MTTAQVQKESQMPEVDDMAVMAADEAEWMTNPCRVLLDLRSASRLAA